MKFLAGAKQVLTGLFLAIQIYGAKSNQRRRHREPVERLRVLSHQSLSHREPKLMGSRCTLFLLKPRGSVQGPPQWGHVEAKQFREMHD